MDSKSKHSINLICKTHNKPHIFICLEPNCQNQIGCSKCHKAHVKKAHFTYSIEEVLDSSMLEGFNQKFSKRFWQIAGKIRASVTDLEDIYIAHLECLFDQLENSLSPDRKSKLISQHVGQRFERIIAEESKIGI